MTNINPWDIPPFYAEKNGLIYFPYISSSFDKQGIGTYYFLLANYETNPPKFIASFQLDTLQEILDKIYDDFFLAKVDFDVVTYSIKTKKSIGEANKAK